MNVLKSTPKVHFTIKNISSSLNIMKKASDCNKIPLKRFFVQFYNKENQFILINNETGLSIEENPNKNISLRLKRG